MSLYKCSRAVDPKTCIHSIRADYGTGYYCDRDNFCNFREKLTQCTKAISNSNSYVCPNVFRFDDRLHCKNQYNCEYKENTEENIEENTEIVIECTNSVPSDCTDSVLTHQMLNSQCVESNHYKCTHNHYCVYQKETEITIRTFRTNEDTAMPPPDTNSNTNSDTNLENDSIPTPKKESENAINELEL